MNLLFIGGAPHPPNRLLFIGGHPHPPSGGAEGYQSNDLIGIAVIACILLIVLASLYFKNRQGSK